ncbi:MAG: MFS transporter [Pseudomonadales bacterium]|nr:MFS transporter [Pseudomonadales bacterium]
MPESPASVQKVQLSNKIFYGWWNVLASFIGLALSYAMFTVFVFGTFITPLEAEFGWQRGPMSLALTIANITVVFASPLLGVLVDRMGVRRVMLVSVILLGLCVASMSQLNGNIWYYYAMHLLIPFLGAGTLPLSYSRVMIAWFAKKRGIALGISLAGFGVGATIMPAIAQFIIENWGWREAYLTFAGMVLFISFPLTYFLLRETPQELGLQPDGNASPADESRAVPATDADIGLTANEAMRTRSYWLIFGSFALIGIGITSILAHLVPLLIGRGIAPATAAMCMSSLGFGLIFGRIFAGFLMDRYFAPYVAAIFLLGLFVGVVILATGTAGPIVFFAAVLVGLATGSEISEIAYIVSRYFGPKAFGQIYGVMFAAFQLGSAMGAYAMGRYFDSAGNYINALWLVAVLVAVGIVLIVLLKSYPDLTDHQLNGE